MFRSSVVAYGVGIGGGFIILAASRFCTRITFATLAQTHDKANKTWMPAVHVVGQGSLQVTSDVWILEFDETSVS